jgi:hypothetical protein
MSTERQIAANRRNAQKSTGPRSVAGKNRASRNAFRHGLSCSIGSNAAFAKELDRLTHEIAGDSKDAATLQHARAAAEGDLALARARQVKAALIQRASAYGAQSSGAATRSEQELRRFFNAVLRGETDLSESTNPTSMMPLAEPEQLANAVRRVLPQLVRMDRYEHRAFARRDRAIRSLIENGNSAKRKP